MLSRITSLLIVLLILVSTVIAALDDISDYYQLPEGTKSIVIEFSSPIVNFGQYEKMIEEFNKKVKLSFYPKLGYTVTFISPSKFEIVFTENLKLFKIYTLSIGNYREITDISNRPVSIKVASKDFKGIYRFVLGKFEIQDAYVGSIRWEKNGFSVEYVLKFSGIPDLESLRENLTIYSGNQVIRDFSLKYKSIGYDSVSIQINELEEGTKYNISIGDNVLVIGGFVKLGKKYNLEFSTPGRLEIVEVKQILGGHYYYYDEQYCLRIKFNNPLEETSDNRRYVKVFLKHREGEVEDEEDEMGVDEIVIEGEYVYIYGDFKEGQSWEILFDMNLTDI
ncbi:MAG: hypothetical protein ABDH28_03920, partial [Brevinematia bacterium]